MNEYVFPSSNFSRRDISFPNSEICTSPAIPSSIEASAPCLLYLIITPFTLSSFLYFFSAATHGFSLSALIESEIFPSLISMIFAFTLSFMRKSALGSSTRDQSISEIWTSPSSPSSILTKTPKSTTPVTSPSISSPNEYLSMIFSLFFCSGSFSEKISFPSLGTTEMIEIKSFCPMNFFNSSRILSLSPSSTRG